MMKRRAFLGGTLSAVTLGCYGAKSATAVAQNTTVQTSPGPLVWPVVTKLQPGIRSFAGHTDTVPDIVAGLERRRAYWNIALSAPVPLGIARDLFQHGLPRLLLRLDKR
jgi:hypothetical protein